MNNDPIDTPSPLDEGGSKKNILFVDDEANFLAGIRRMLRHQRDRWELHFADSVDQALACCAETSFDTIVSDINMPGKTGFDLLHTLKANEHTRTIPVIILTGNAENNMKRRALDDGATDLLNKPVSQEDLLARLRNATRLKEYEDILRDQNLFLESKVRERTAALAYSRQDIIWRLAKAGEFRDEDTGEHVVRVAACSQALSEALDQDVSFTKALYATSPLHDIGKIGIPDGILLKPGKLSEDERRIMERHCKIGASILIDKPKGVAFLGAERGVSTDTLDEEDSAGINLREMAAEIAMTHHEKWDGSGYPQGLSGNEIPLSGQIVAIADVYDALRSERAYKAAFSKERTLEVMRLGRGRHFSPELFDLFESVQGRFEGIRDRFIKPDEVTEDADETCSIR